jgi:hypothetical protein
MLNDRIHALVKLADGSVEKWNVASGLRVATYGAVDFDAQVCDAFSLGTRNSVYLWGWRQIESEFVRRSVPSWCVLDLRLGCITVVLDEADAYAAWVTAEALGASFILFTF